MARRKDHSPKELKEMILNAAWDLIGTEGQSALTARKIAAHIGYAPGTIYNIYKSMDDLQWALNARLLDMMHDALSAPTYDKLSLTDNLRHMADIYADFTKEQRTYWLMVYTHRATQKNPAPEWYLEKVSMLFTPLEEILKPHLPKNEIAIQARMLWSAIHGIYFLEATGKTPLITGKEKLQNIAYKYIDQLTQNY